MSIIDWLLNIIMSCKHPIYAIRQKDNSGKQFLYFPYGFNSHLPGDVNSNIDVQDLWRTYGRDNVISIPCGYCLSCKLDYARSWSVRCYLESLSYSDNCFLTLTYDDDHLPVDGHVSKIAMQKFIRKLRTLTSNKIRYFLCGEYGTKTKRAHYHLIVFNYYPQDCYTVAGHRTSKELCAIWPFGFVEVGDVSTQSCAYVARYCTKKIYSNKDDSFILMSRRPGIGYQYFKEHYSHLYDYDHVICNGSKYSLPRYFDKKLDEINPLLLDIVKEERLSKTDKVISDLMSSDLSDIENLNFKKGEAAERTFVEYQKKKGGF